MQSAAVAIVPLASGKHIDTDKLQPGQTYRYGRVWKPGFSRLQIELVAFRDDFQPPFGLGRYEHAKRLIKILWPFYEWTSWSGKKWRALCENDLAALMGCAGSGKSRDLGMYALLCWWSAPQDTAVAVTSESIEGAINRVWGEIIRAHQEAQWQNDDGSRADTPGVLTAGPARVKLKGSVDGMTGGGQQSIMLVAAGNAFTDSALRTLQGLHNNFVLLILDELQDLTAGVIGDSVLGNLGRNVRFQLVAAGNIGDVNDPLGKLCRPVTAENGGYDDVDENTDEWKIARGDLKGVCIRLDAEKTPNYERVEQGLPELRFLPTVEEVEAKKSLKDQGVLELGSYYRQYKAFITPKVAEDGRYSVNIMTKFKTHLAANWAKEGGYLVVGGCDPAYTSGGDKFILKPVHYGQRADGLWTIEFQPAHALQYEATDGTPRNYDMVRQTKRLCLDLLNISPTNLAVDVSGENPLGDIFANEWSDEIMRVNFQGKPSELPVSLRDRRPCSHEYANMSAELWGALAVFIRHDQVRGVTTQHAKELAARKTERGAQNKLVIEAKPKMRKRLGYSPDEADGGNLGLAVLRVRHGAVAGAENTAETSRQLKQQQEKSVVLPVRLASQRGIQRVWGR